MPNLIRRIATRLRRLNERPNIVATGDENEYYAWADQRLDEIAEEARLRLEELTDEARLRDQLTARGYRLVDKDEAVS